ncbi:MAG: 30S ribosomal protein S20 [Acidimicrobiia bacterium]|nr:30S ribosomal protein S20 [Acidimicrobiia bacterium]MCY4457897.1 30S ribosomal protein S20 [Acidimicrobiaceae bacterium]
MANIKSQIKRNRQNRTRNHRNRQVRSEINTRTRVAIDAIETDQETDTAQESVRLAIKRIDKAAQKGVLHKNAAARKKRRLMQRLNARHDD